MLRPTLILVLLLAATAPPPTSATLRHLPTSLVEGFRSLSASIHGFGGEDDMDSTIVIEKDVTVRVPTIETFVSPDIIIEHEDKIDEGVDILRSLGDHKLDEAALIKLLLTEDDLAFEEGLAILEEVKDMGVPSSEEGAAGRELETGEGEMEGMSEDIADEVILVETPAASEETLVEITEEETPGQETTSEPIDEIVTGGDEGLIRNLEEPINLSEMNEETSEMSEETSEEINEVEGDISEEGEIVDEIPEEEIIEEPITEEPSEETTTSSEAPMEEMTTITEEPSEEITTTSEAPMEEMTTTSEEPSEETTTAPIADDRSDTIGGESGGVSGFFSGLFG